LAAEKQLILIIDDDSAKSFASIIEVETHGTLYILYLSFCKKIITENQARNIFKRMVKDGFYVSIEIYSRFMELFTFK
jgi:predicted nucleic acid-binding protein